MATEDDDDTRRRILARASAASGIDFDGYRHPVMVRRVGHRMAVTGCDSLEEYLQHLDDSAEEVPRLVDALLIKTTELFREQRTLDSLVTLLPALIEHRTAEGNSQLRAWVPGCSTGEEAFSMACLLLAAVERAEHPLSVRVFGSDADPGAIEQARRGVIVSKLAAPSIPEWARRWFSESPDGLSVAPAIRAITTFACHDLLDEQQPAPPDSVLASFDVVSCRNVLIYLGDPHRRRVLSRLIAAVEPCGFLLLGDAEATPPEETSGLVHLEAGVPLYTRDG
jgi:chemotaxis methyl-accepting protein methylase